MSSKRLTIFLVTLLLIIILTFIFYNNYHITSNTLELSGISSSKYALRIYDVSDNLLSCTTYYQNPSTDQSNFVKYVVEYTFENGINTKTTYKNYYTSKYYAKKAYEESQKDNVSNMKISRKGNTVYKIDDRKTDVTIDSIIKDDLNNITTDNAIFVKKDGIVTRMSGNRNISNERGE